MVSLASYYLHSSPEHSRHTRKHVGTPFPAGSQLLSLGQYLVDMTASESDLHPAFHLSSEQLVQCKVYPLQTFQLRAPLVYRGIEGVHRVLDATRHGEKVFVFSPKPFGDLHNYLKQRRKLKEGVAARLFQQIVLLVRDAHRKNVVLRDLKLKKFVFEDQEK